jgi:hypothetical protein
MSLLLSSLYSLPPHTVTSDGHTIEYRNLVELCQGGPELGYFYINGNIIGDGARFGGPFICTGKDVYVPLFKKGFFSSGFILQRVDIKSGVMTEITKKEPVIWLNKIENSDLSYYADMNRTTLKVVLVKEQHCCPK